MTRALSVSSRAVRTLGALVQASHAGPTAAVTVVMVGCGWSLGWRGWPLVFMGTTVLVGQLSVGWSNDAFDADLDRRGARTKKPTVAHLVQPQLLWSLAAAALVVASAASWAVAGLVGGTFHVFALLMAWAYNVRLSRTDWSWLPYALAFGCAPAFLSLGLDGRPPSLWSVVVFAIIGVSAHLANALPDIESDRAAGVGGIAIRLGSHRTMQLLWVLLAAGSAILAIVAFRQSPVIAAVIIAVFCACLCFGAFSGRRAAMFQAVMLAVVFDVLVVVLGAGSLR
jgi:4-hydroxybenzoate polyprenyltransferase